MKSLSLGLKIAILSFSALYLAASLALAGQAKPQWQVEWEKMVAAAEKEGQVTVYAPPGRQYEEAIMAFQGSYPRIRLKYLPGSGTDNSKRLFAERRAGKYLADAFVSGSGTQAVLLKANVQVPLAPALILPEAKDTSGWLNKKHYYADPKGEYVFIFAGNVDTSVGAYNTRLVDPKEIRSHWDVLNPKWRGKMVAYDPKERGHIQNMRGIYYNPRLGGEFLRRLFREMELTTGRDQRQMLDWVASGKFHIYLFASSNDVEDAARKGLAVGVLNAPPAEGYMSAGFGHLSLIANSPHPNAARVFANWLLSREGQLQWQKKSDNNSLRTDIPKDMLTNQRAVAREGVEYLNASLPQYEDVRPVLKIIDDALAAAGKR